MVREGDKNFCFSHFHSSLQYLSTQAMRTAFLFESQDNCSYFHCRPLRLLFWTVTISSFLNLQYLPFAKSLVPRSVKNTSTLHPLSHFLTESIAFFPGCTCISSSCWHLGWRGNKVCYIELETLTFFCS